MYALWDKRDTGDMATNHIPWLVFLKGCVSFLSGTEQAHSSPINNKQMKKKHQQR